MSDIRQGRGRPRTYSDEERHERHLESLRRYRDRMRAAKIEGGEPAYIKNKYESDIARREARKAYMKEYMRSLYERMRQ